MKKFFDKYHNEVRVLIEFLTFCLGYLIISYIINIVCFDDKDKFQDYIMNLLYVMSGYGCFLGFDKSLTSRVKNLALVISSVSLLALAYFIFVMGVRYSA